MADGSPVPIFIVGAPRSGTTMLAAMIGSHPDYAVGPETQFFSKLSPETLSTAIADPDWPRLAVDAISSLSLAGQSVAELFGSDRQALTGFLASRKPSVRAMLEALTVPFADRRGKPGWAEKTPNHLLNLETIRSEWPDARIVRIVRDPRDSATSTCKLPTFSDSFLANIYLWRSWQDRALPFLKSDSRSITIRYETLVTEPEKELGRLCQTIGIPYDSNMLRFSEGAADVSSAAEPWKVGVSGKLSGDRAFAWKRSLDSRLRQIADQVTHEYLEALDYERGELAKRTRYGYRMSPEFVEANQGFLMAQLDRGIRWLPTPTPQSADRIFEQPPYSRFDHPREYARLVWGKFSTLPGVAERLLHGAG